MSSSKGLLIFAIFLGISGLGLGGYTLFFALPVNTQSSIRNIWSVSKSSSVNVNNVDTKVPDLYIIATVNRGESLHVIFNTNVFFYSQSGIEILTIYLSLNDKKVTSPVITFGAEFGQKVWDSITLQYSNLTISPGVYNITVISVVTDPTPEESLYDMTLLAFTCA
ncbi:MAG: hypothetical protein ACFFA8_01390 [Promethearchaeota archaeon]